MLTAPRVIPEGYLPVSWSFLARLDGVPCDIFIASGTRGVLYATVGAQPDSLREKAQTGVTLLVRESDQAVLRRNLTTSLRRTLDDPTMPPPARSAEAYEITATIIAGTFRRPDAFDREEVDIVSDTIELLTTVLSADDKQLWNMVAAFQYHHALHDHAIKTAIYALSLAKAAGIEDLDRLRDIGKGAILMDIGLTTGTPIAPDPETADPADVRRYRMHPITGYRILSHALGETPAYAHIILEHHERLDGSGFPAGRRRGAISQDALIVGIAEAFDGFVMGAPPAPALSPFDALRAMRFGQEGRFEETLLRRFVGLLGGWNAVKPGS